ncbi:hypothetical protein KC345_g1903 [Hortaea werneckii]|nr:hypothetical protein KC345_g1903 [Hortaea werneckii]
MVFWKSSQHLAQPAPAATSTGMDHSEEMLAEVDEPPDDLKRGLSWTQEHYSKAPPAMAPRRESLLTRQLHSETEHSDEDHMPHPPRALSTHSTWSTTSTADLTSDDGHSMPSPGMSPPLPPTEARNALPVTEKPLDKKLKIVGQEEAAASQEDTGSEKSVEATLGRKRCIMFACKGKEEAKPKPPSPTSAAQSSESTNEKSDATEQPKRKCTIKFACPTKTTADKKPSEAGPAKRPVSPPPPQRKLPAKSPEHKVHRGSDSTVTHGSPKQLRKSPSMTQSTPSPNTTEASNIKRVPTLSRDSDEETGTEATRFHEFASSDDEPEEWVQEATCYRSRLTVTDTLMKENVIRKACEEVEEEAVAEEDDDEEDEDNDGEDQDDEQDDVDAEVDEEDSDDSDAGFHSDDEDGFAASDSDEDEEGSDYEWWRPGGSTAATSIEHLERLNLNAKSDDARLSSSVGSISSDQMSPSSSKKRRRRSPSNHTRTASIPIANRNNNDDLPDSTDFVCGTLDEDRPLEQAYINRKKVIEAAKHKPRPQDIDPSFPTSDPELDEEDDEDLDDPEEEDDEDQMVHGEMDSVREESTPKRRSSPAPRRKSTRSPPPPVRYHSPPPTKRVTKHRSPPPPLKQRASNRSPPPPRKLFGGYSPKRARSPAPTAMMTSPPNTRRTSPSRGAAFAKKAEGLAARPDLTRTASLPRTGGFLLSRLHKKHSDDGVASDTTAQHAHEIPKRGAIDIVKGLEKKRQRRKEKMWQKMCAKNAAKGEKTYKVKPGRGAERMREVGLELQRYRGKGEHILSV